MALAVNSQMPSGVGVTSTTSPWTWSFTNTSGTLLYLFFTIDGNFTTPTATYGGTSMTMLGASPANIGGGGSIYLFRLLSPATGANNFVITWSTGTLTAIAAAISFTGNASTPDNGGATIFGYSSFGTVHSLTVGSLSGNIVIMGTAYGDSGHSTQSGTLSALKEVNSGSFANNLAVQYQSASAGSTAMTDTGTVSTSWATIGIEVRDASVTFPVLYGNMAVLGIITTPTQPISVVNLTTEGSSDWAKWAQVATTDFIHKSTGGTQISNVTVVGTQTLFTNNPVAFSWGDGTPTGSYTGTAGAGIGENSGAVNNTYTFTVKADTTARILRFYCGQFAGASPQLTAHLSDSSQPDYVDSTLNSGNASATAIAVSGVYTIYYKAASASQTLTVTWKMTTAPGSATFNVCAATLALAPVTGNLFRQSLLNALGTGGPFFANPIG
jgi:hypothetical protein